MIMDRDAVLDSVQDQVENHLQRMTAEDLVVRIPYGASAKLKVFIAQWLVQSSCLFSPTPRNCPIESKNVVSIQCVLCQE